MWRALALFVGVILAAGVYVLVTGDASAGPTTSAATGGPAPSEFGYALAAGSVALAATLLVTRPRFRTRR